jgi:ElaB/YqjD/DUF883 family membrane-anchored ribosome-binding protein
MNQIPRPNGAAARDGVDELREKASQIKHDLGDLGSAARHAAVDSASAVRDAASAYLEEGRDQALQMGRALEQQVRQNPMPSLLIAAGVGFLAGLCLIRR